MKNIKSASDLKTSLIISDCINSSRISTTYKGIHKVIGGKIMTVKMFNLSNTNLSVQDIKCYFNNLLIFMKRKLKCSLITQIPTSECEVGCVIENNLLFVATPFINAKSLRSILRNKVQTLPNVSNSIKQMLSLLISYGGLKDHLTTSSNLFINQFGQMYSNFTSIQGLMFIKSGISITRNQFNQIYPYLDSQIFQRSPKDRNNIYLKIRSLVVNLLKIVIDEEFNLLQSEKINELWINKDEPQIKLLLSSVSRKFSQILNKDRIKQKIQIASKLSNINLSQLFDRVLVIEQKIDYQTLIKDYLYWGNKNFINSYNQSVFLAEHNITWQNQVNKQFYQERGLSNFHTYIPIKYGLSFLDILSHKIWYESIQANKKNQSIKRISNCIFENILRLKQNSSKCSRGISTNFIYKSIQNYLKSDSLNIISV